MAEFDTRIQQKSDTQANFESNNPILLANELVIVKMTDGSIKFKVGDGTSHFNSLEYTDKYLTDDISNLQSSIENIPDVENFVTASDVSGIEATIPPTFDGHTVSEFVLKADVENNLNSDLTNVPLSANQGKVLNQTIQQNTTNIGNIETEVESINTTVSELSSSLSEKLNLSGGTMTGALIAQSNTNYTTGQVRNIYLSTEAPTNDVGSNGDVWIVYGG